MARKPPAENKSASPAPPTLDETNAKADDEQKESAKLAASGKQPTREQLAKSGYRVPARYFEQADPNAGHESTEQKAGDGGANSPAKE